VNPETQRLFSLMTFHYNLLPYFPTGVPFLGDVEGIINSIFNNARSFFVFDGHNALAKDYIRAGIHRRVLALMPAQCVVCGVHPTKDLQTHHIKREQWSWGRAIGFTVLCHPCHDALHHFLPVPDYLAEPITFDVLRAFAKSLFLPVAAYRDSDFLLVRRNHTFFSVE
jgi:hypothetical protein